MYRLLLALFMIFFINANSQSLGEERIRKLNNTIARITIDSLGASGTGFVVSKMGHIATCNHVIQPAFYRNAKTKNIDSIRVIHATFRSGNEKEYVVLPEYYGDEYLNSLIKDFIILAPREVSSKEYDFLTIGRWEDVKEGDEIYTAGFPLQIKQRIISKGVFSTKYEGQQNLINGNGKQTSYPRKEAWVDLTLNKGNSGGPIILMGKTAKKDKVVGLATFLWNPYANNSFKLSQKLNEIERQNPNLNVNKLLAYMFEAISKNSLGISGAVPSDGIYLKLQQLNQEQ
ncbi:MULTISPECIES: serine protease [Flavobacteriaceae]|uniref:S1 family peptidase n=1 Tax=Flavobacteriaceae TaxID=49546 RepID=UPI001490D9DB|nr:MULTISPECIES: serine protease [Allomuricauda]MDC6366932.1 serine protease [Muricauda sp. AC10]